MFYRPSWPPSNFFPNESWSELSFAKVSQREVVFLIFPHQDLISFYALGFTDPTVISEDWGSVRELATHYVQLIMKEQRHGPYFLGGYSYGGLLAYEMASLLIEQNQSVEFVAMIDTFPWSSRSQTITSRLLAMQRVELMSSQQAQVWQKCKIYRYC